MRLAMVAASFLASACSGLRPPPRIVPPACHLASEEKIQQLWRCLDEVPRPNAVESGFASTVRVVTGDTARKARDQDPNRACQGPKLPGFEPIDGEKVEGGRAPLFAWLAPPTTQRTVVILIHGLLDSKNSRYVTLTARALVEQGFGVLVPDMRWHGCLLSTTWLPTLGREEALDLAAWARWLKNEKYPGHPVGLLGYSIGGLYAIQAVASRATESAFDAGAVAISPPAVLNRTLPSLDEAGYLADRGLTVLIRSSFRSYLLRRLRLSGIPIAPDRPFRGFIEWLLPRLPAPQSPAQDYLRDASPEPRIAQCRRPLLILTATNDPLFSEAVAEALAAAAAPNRFVHVIETPAGGHIGQVGTYPSWTMEILGTFFQAAPAFSSD